MTSQIFPNIQNLKSNQTQSIIIILWQSTAMQWLSIMVLFAAVILFPERPAWGGDVDLHVSQTGIRGYAHQVALGDVLEVLADEGGYDIYLDNALAEMQVSFDIPQAIPMERAIQIIVHPHSHALVYATTAYPKRLRIDQIQIYYGDPTLPSVDQDADPPVAHDSTDEGHEEKQLLAMPIGYGDK